MACLATFRLSSAQQAISQPSFRFMGTDYLFRWTDGKLFEFTPRHQSDLDKWTEMVSIIVYHDVRTGEGLAAQANGVLENYKAHHGVVRKTSSVPMT
jgi:hypothetical protein